MMWIHSLLFSMFSYMKERLEQWYHLVPQAKYRKDKDNLEFSSDSVHLNFYWPYIYSNAIILTSQIYTIYT